MTEMYHPLMSPRPFRDAPPDFEPEKGDDVMQVLLDCSADEIEEWFRVPWRDGRNAIRLCLDAALFKFAAGPDSTTALLWLTDLVGRTRETLTTVDYNEAERLAGELSRSSTAADVFLGAAMKIAANWIANSDGGGYVPNVYLTGAFWPFLRDGSLDDSWAIALVGKHRAHDLGLDWMAARDPDHTFRWLWMNQRYRLAFVVARR